MKNKFEKETGKGPSISTVDLLVLTSLDQLLFKLKLNLPFLMNNLS